MSFRSKGIAVIYLVVPPSDNTRLAFLEAHFKFNKCDEKKISESSLQNSVIMKISNVMEVGFLEFSEYVASFIRYWSMFKQKSSFMEVSVRVINKKTFVVSVTVLDCSFQVMRSLTFIRITSHFFVNINSN